MLLTLIKKQYRECFRMYFVNGKTGKARSKFGMIGMFVLFAVLMLVLAGAFFGMSALLADLLDTQFAWLYYSLMGILAILLGTFGSVFNTYAALYLAKDNELLLSMPIPPSKILLTRISLVFGLALLYSSVVWLPGCVFGWIAGYVSVKIVLFELLLGILIALFVTVLTCALGWLIALLAVRMKNKSLGIVALSLAFIAAYYYFCSNIGQFLMSIVMNAAAIGSGIRTWGNLFYQLGMAGAGDVGAMLIFSAICIVLTVVCFWVLTKTFAKIVTRSEITVKKDGKVTVRSSGTHSALLRRELRRFMASPVYMLNCGFGMVMLLAADVMAVLKMNFLSAARFTLQMAIPELTKFLPLGVFLIVAMIISIDFISAPSISLEGKNLWILRVLPVSSREILNAKLELHILFNLPLTVISCILLGCVFGLSWTEIIGGTAYCAVLIWFNGVFGLIIGVLRPNFTWTSEAMPVKQSLNTLIAMVVGALVPFLTGLAAYFLRSTADSETILIWGFVIVTVAAGMMNRWLNSKGAQILDTLN